MIALFVEGAQAQDCKALWQQAIKEISHSGRIVNFSKYIDGNCKDSLAEAHLYLGVAFCAAGMASGGEIETRHE